MGSALAVGPAPAGRQALAVAMAGTRLSRHHIAGTGPRLTAGHEPGLARAGKE